MSEYELNNMVTRLESECQELRNQVYTLIKIVEELQSRVVLKDKEITVDVPVIDFGLDESAGVLLPNRNKKGDCGFDAYALEKTVIPAHSSNKVPIGIGLIIPEPFGVKAETRSGNFLAGLSVGSAWVDRGYRGQIFILMQNITDKDIIIEKGDRPCSIELELTFNMNLVSAKDYYSEEEYREIMNTERGDTGFGSSGK